MNESKHLTRSFEMANTTLKNCKIFGTILQTHHECRLQACYEAMEELGLEWERAVLSLSLTGNFDDQPNGAGQAGQDRCHANQDNRQEQLKDDGINPRVGAMQSTVRKSARAVTDRSGKS